MHCIVLCMILSQLWKGELIPAGGNIAPQNPDLQHDCCVLCGFPWPLLACSTDAEFLLLSEWINDANILL